MPFSTSHLRSMSRTACGREMSSVVNLSMASSMSGGTRTRIAVVSVFGRPRVFMISSIAFAMSF